MDNVDQELENCEAPHSKYFRFGVPSCLCCNYSSHSCSTKVAKFCNKALLTQRGGNQTWVVGCSCQPVMHRIKIVTEVVTLDWVIRVNPSRSMIFRLKVK